MGQTLTNGIYLPAEGERNCYEGLAANWTALDGLIGGYNVHISNTTIHVTAEDKAAWNGKADASALTAHTGDTTIHVTAEDKTKWDAVTTKANDADVVHTSGNETVGGQKVFSDINAISSSAEIGVSAGNNSFKVLDKNKKTISRYEGGTFSDGMAYSYFLVNNGSDVFNGVSLYQPSANSAQLRPYSSTLSLQLGASNRYFSDCYTSKINGITPSSLSLPSDTYVDISGYVTNLTGGNNLYTAPENGWVHVDSNSTISSVIINNSRGYSSGFIFTGQLGRQRNTLPVCKGDLILVNVNCASLNVARFIPCLGNI